jgi:hypothetical protein
VTTKLLLAPRTEKEAKVALAPEDFFPNEVVMWLLRWRGRVEGSGGCHCATVPTGSVHGLGLRGQERAGLGAFAHGRVRGKVFPS